MMRQHTTARITRRHFGRISTAGAIATAIPTAARGAEVKRKGWIDAHVHVWTPDIKKYPLADGYDAESMQPPSFTPEQLFAHCKPSGVDRIVLIQMSFYKFDNRYMLEMIKQHTGVFSGVAIVDHHQKNVADQMKKLAAGGVRGFRIHPRGDEAKQWVRDDGMGRLWKTAGQEGLAVCPLINPTDLPAIERLCRKFPGTSVVIDHFARIGVSGKVEQDYLNQLCRMAKLPQVHVKVSAFYALGKKNAPYLDLVPMIRRVIDAYGPSRLMWASDCPFQVDGEHTYSDSISLITDRLDFLSVADKRAILQETAERVFFS